MSEVQIAPPCPPEPPALTKSALAPPFGPNGGTNQTGNNQSTIVNRKRKLETSEKENEPENDNGDSEPETNPEPEKKLKKLKWETILRPKTGLNIEHVNYFNKEETNLYFNNLENEIKYLRYP